MNKLIVLATACCLGLAAASAPAAEKNLAASGARYCKGPTNDLQLIEFREEVNYALRAFPSAYYINVCVYRESEAFEGGSPGSLVATLDAENVQGLPSQPHPSPSDVQCAQTGDVPCIRARQVQAFVPQTHPESVRLPADPLNPMARIVAIVRDVGG